LLFNTSLNPLLLFFSVYDLSKMAVPVIDMKKLLNGEERELTMAKIQNACQEWGFFQVILH
jgi:isopenicillin N synthase-like dioxygenase